MRKNPWIKAGILAVLALVVFLLAQVAPSQSALVERLYARGVYPIYAQLVSSVTGLLPVSLSEIVLFVILPVGLIVSIVRWCKRKTHWQQFVSGWLSVALAFYLLFQAGWGFNYSRLPYAEIAGLTTAPVEVDKVEELVRELAMQANALRAELTDGDEPYRLDVSKRQVMRKINPAYRNAAENRPWLAGHYGAPKLAMVSTPLAYLNIAGIFSPFTMNAHVNAHEADVLLAATAMHEAAHLRGFAREDEANYIAYVVCMESDETYVRYSGTLLGLIYAGNALAGADMERYAAIYAQYSPGVIADLRAYNAAWEPYEGKAAEVHEQVNDAYLKANNQTDGVKSYGRMVDLMIAQMERDKNLR